MNLIDFKKKINLPARKATSCFLVRDDEVLLAMDMKGKKRGQWSGINKLVDQNEGLFEATTKAIRRILGVSPLSLNKAAEVNLYFDKGDIVNEIIHVFLSDNWDGQPKQHDDYRLDWFLKDRLPFNQMMPDDIHWLPKVLSGNRLKCEFLYQDRSKLLDMNVREQNS